MMCRVPTEQGKQGNGKTIPVKENTGNLEFFQNTGKIQGIWFAKVVNSLILKAKNILIFAANIFHFF